MYPLYTENEFREATSRQLLPILCLHCGKTFHLTKRDVQSKLNPNHNRNGNFCSNQCQRLHENPPITVQCDQCHTSFIKSPKEIKKSSHHFCSSSCAAKWNNTHKTKGTRVSKLEVWLAAKLPTLYPDLEFHFNRKDAINGELDIFIPSLRLAFELNGIFHYEPIYGSEKLGRIWANDARKMLACAEHSIELCVIDVSSLSYFKEQRAVKFLTIIRNLIDSKLSGSSPIPSDCLASTA
jgi:hypothetical protein